MAESSPHAAYCTVIEYEKLDWNLPLSQLPLLNGTEIAHLACSEKAPMVLREAALREIAIRAAWAHFGGLPATTKICVDSTADAV